MLGSFPTPYPDELLCSLVARYHVRSGNKSFRQTHEELFETVDLQPDKIVLPNNLNFLVSQLPQGSKLTVESLIKKNTLYSFFRNFLTPVEIYSFKDLLRSKSSTSISQAAKISDKEHNQRLKFCPQCLAENEQLYGEAYWHRQHQIPGMLACLKHEVPLLESTVLLENKQIHYYAASQVNLNEADKANYSPEFKQKALSIAEELDWLSHNYIEFQGMTWLRNKYKSLLIDKGFVTKYSRTKFKYHDELFTETFVEFYGKEFLQAIQLQIWEKLNIYLEYSLFSCDIAQTIDRTTHVLLIKFLCGSIRNIFD
ncbi:MAG: TniQ family protein [Cyanobacteria bacterium P01_A01_bin.83]